MTKNYEVTPRIVPLGKFIPMVSRQWVEPTHLAPMLHLLERAIVEPVRACISVCPRVGKTEALLHAIPWWLLQRPDLRIAYVSYSQRFAEKKSRRARALALAAGVPLDPDVASRSDWRTTAGEGGVWATSKDGSVTGEGFDIIILDDPHKDRAEAESAAERDRIDEFTRDTLYTRLEPNGSMFVNHARWHVDDQIGRLARDGWQTINIPAVGEDGASIWPERWPIERYREIEETLGPYGWSSLYLGAPQPRGGRPFDGVEFFDELPDFAAEATGVDFAYTARTSADASVAVRLATDGEHFYVLDVIRQQVAAPEFRATLRGIADSFPATTFHSYIGGTERAVIDFLAEGEEGVLVNATPAVADKFVRAQPASAAWCAKKILVPRSVAALRPPGESSDGDTERRPPWLDAFVSEITSFTGVRDRRDDQVDALVAAYDALRNLTNRSHGMEWSRGGRWGADHWGHGGGRGF